jgi:hypothetical protein
VTIRQATDVLIARDELVDAPAARACDDQTFELPTGLYVAMGMMFTGFIAVLSLAFSGHMAVAFGVIFAFVAAFFAIPGIFTRTARDSRGRAMSWGEFVDAGIDTANGRTGAASATLLVLTLPFVILSFAVAIAAIAALV